MKKPLSRAFALAATAVSAVLSVTALVVAAGPSGADPATSASAAPSGSTAAPPPPTAARGADIPVERSQLPKAEEWASAREIDVGTTACKGTLVREWLRLRCDENYGVSLVAGDPKDVHVAAHGHLLEWDEVAQKLKPSYVDAILPIERGKARIVTFLDLSGNFGDYGPAMPGEGVTFHVWWRDGAANPSIVATTSSE